MQYGAFIMGAQLFDASKFAISSAEASVMDPQQRLLPEGWVRRFARGPSLKNVFARQPYRRLLGLLELRLCPGHCRLAGKLWEDSVLCNRQQPIDSL